MNLPSPAPMSPVVSFMASRLWHRREALMDQLRMAGLPAILDGSHIVVHGVTPAVRWLTLLFDPEMAQLAGESKGQLAELQQGINKFREGLPQGITIQNKVAPGFSLQGGEMQIDGVSLIVEFAGSTSPIMCLPTTETINREQFQRYEVVALVPRPLLAAWRQVMAAATAADRTQAQRTFRVYNGNDVDIAPISLSDIVMTPLIQRNFVSDMVGFLQRQNWYQERGLPWTRKYLLNGPPGTGKTSLARWAATELGLPAMGFDFTDRWADGQTLMGCLQAVARMAPALLILDDLDRVLSGQNRTAIDIHTFQTAFSGVGALNGVVVVATSNDDSVIKGPMRRRFDMVVQVPLPDLTGRLAYLQRMLRLDLPSTAIELYDAAVRTDGKSFDDLRVIVTVAANHAFEAGRTQITGPDLLGALGTAPRQYTTTEG